MPEGDTVWLTADRLARALTGRPVTTFDLRVPQLATADLRGRTVTAVRAVGKHLLTRFDDATTLHSHLRMDGSWYLSRAGRTPRRHPEHMIRARIGNVDWLATGYRVHDLRLVPTDQEWRVVGHLGPDVLGEDWDPGQVLRRLADQPDRAIGEALLDQRVLCGVGNMYKAEVLFVTGTNPFTPTVQVADPGAVVAACHRLIRANRDRPSQNTTGSLGGQEEHYVYGRLGQPCRRCGTAIRRAEQGRPPQARITYWCPTCQPGPTPPGTRDRSARRF